MTQMLDRPATDVDRRMSTDVLERPTTVEREEIRQLPPVGRPPRRIFRWLGWLLGIAAIAAISWIVIAEVTGDGDAVTSPYVLPEGAVTADPKARTPVVLPGMVDRAIQTGQPGVVPLSEIVTLGSQAPIQLEDATVNPMIYWAVQPTYASFMDEATVSPIIYWSTAPEPSWSLATYELISTYNPTPVEEVAPLILGPGNYDDFMV